MRKAHVLSVAAATILSTGALLAAPASAGTGVTFTVNSGALSIAEPSTTANLGTALSSITGTSVTGKLGSTTVTDARGSLAGWAASISSTNFDDGASHVIPAGNAKAYVLATDGPTLVQGIAVPSAGSYLTSATGLTLSNSGQSFVTATATGSNQVSYNPSLTITIPSTVVAGTYTGTVTQTVA